MKETVVVSVRMPKELRDRIDRRADTDYRSLSQEIVWLVTYALESLETVEKPKPRLLCAESGDPYKTS